ncbi:chlorophyll A-B binding protein [Aureococcus anophagefferens]|nr:chlorophyll A-B binding protein [Aureococcus anophagefferens]
MLHNSSIALCVLGFFGRFGQAKRVARVGATSVCAVISPDLPGFCSCDTKKALGGTLTCSVNFLDLDTIGVVVDMEPCADPMNFDVDVRAGVPGGARLVSCLFQVTEADLGIDYEIEKLTAGERVPVPGLSLDVPVLGSAGVNLVARITGSVQELTLSFGLGGGVARRGGVARADQDFWNLGNEGTIGYLRHAEIKHGRVAMAGFLGFLAQCTPVEQWDNIPLIGKLQIFTFVGMLESYGEGAGQPDGYVHYTKGGLPGYFPPIEGRIGPFPIGNLNLYKPFDIFPEQSEDEKARGRQVEINNGRLAMLGLISLLTESNGLIVPPLDGIEGFPKYAGNVMIPFSADFSLY